MNKKERALRTLKVFGFCCFAAFTFMILVAFEPLKSLWDMLYEFGGAALQRGVQGGIMALVCGTYSRHQKKRDEEKQKEKDAP
jgi:hypothetical protein